MLLVDRDRRLIKTRAFEQRTYIGDPFNVLRIFNEKEVDEIFILDIDATMDDRAPDAGFLKELAAECFMPLAFGGGLKTVQQCESVMSVGIEKVVIGSSATDEDFVAKAAATFGSQAIVGCIDFRRIGNSYEVAVRGGKTTINRTPVEYALQLQECGVGEILLQSIDRDGGREGYCTELISSVSTALEVPLVALGGAGCIEHLHAGLRAGASAAASGSTFVFIGRLRGVLITYPTEAELSSLGSQEQS